MYIDKSVSEDLKKNYFLEEQLLCHHRKGDGDEVSQTSRDDVPSNNGSHS